MKNNLKVVFVMILFLMVNSTLFAKDQPEYPTLKFSVFTDTIVTGFDTEFRLQTSYNLKSISIAATGCSIMLKDAKKGIYIAKAPVTSIGKTSVITISLKNENGNFKELVKYNIPIVGMSTEMRKRYVYNQTHKK